MISHTALRQSFLIALILGLSLLLFTNLYFIIDALLGSMILGILSVKPIQFMVRRRIKRSHAELIYFTGALLGVLVPLTILFFVLKGQWSSFFHFLQGYGQSLEIIGQKLNEKFGISLVNEDMIKSTAIKISSFVPKLLNSTLDLLTTIGVMYFLLYFFIKEGTSIRRGLLSILPLKDSNRESIYSLTYQSVLSNSLMMPLVALFQGLIAWVGYALAGVSHSFIWFVATFLASMIPFFGAALIYIPLGILLFFKGQQSAGIFVMVWGFAAVSSADNFLRIFFMKKFDNTHPLITFLGVMAGLNIFRIFRNYFWSTIDLSIVDFDQDLQGGV
jgi:predicted PurR-regulated permease PerM